MSINPTDFRQLIIRPTLTKLGTWSASLENLLLGTAAQASQLGVFLISPSGIGIYQIEKNRHHSVWDEYFAFDPELASTVRGFASQREFLSKPDMELATNLSYATAIAWGIYAQSDAIIPDDENDIDALAECWCMHYNADIALSKKSFTQNYKKILRREKEALAA